VVRAAVRPEGPACATSRQGDPRANQKKRTRAALVEAATALVREGTPPTVAEAAERALVSRATAYRYFPTQELLLDVAQVEPMVRPVEELVAGFVTDDAAQRLAELVDTFMSLLLSEEVLVRSNVRVFMDTWLENRREGHDLPLRPGRRVRWLDQALKPVNGQLDRAARRRLHSALALTLGPEAMISLKDVAGINDQEEIIATLQWAADALLRTALHDAETAN
jgi:AcrR family transcriptional regulator